LPASLHARARAFGHGAAQVPGNRRGEDPDPAGRYNAHIPQPLRYGKHTSGVHAPGGGIHI